MGNSEAIPAYLRAQIDKIDDYVCTVCSFDAYTREGGLLYAMAKGKCIYILKERGVDLPDFLDNSMVEDIIDFDGPIFSKDYYSALKKMMEKLDVDKEEIDRVMGMRGLEIRSTDNLEADLEEDEKNPDLVHIELGRMDS